MFQAITDLADTVGFIDPASGRAKARKTSSRSADIVVASDELGRVFVLHAWAGRIPTTAHTDRIFKLVADFRPRVLGIDASAMQSLYADSLMREAKQRVARLPLLPVKMPTNVDKESRIRTILQKVIADGRLFIQPGQTDLHQELEAFPGGQTLDLVDALSEAIALLRKSNPRRVAEEEKDARLDYLRSTGAPQFYIDQVARVAR